MQSNPATSAYNPKKSEQTDVLDHEGVQIMANGNSYDPGPSFVDDDQPIDRLTEMPAWLQSFAAQESNVSNEDQDVQEEEAESQPDEPVAFEDVSSDLPDWLRDEPVDATQDAKPFDKAPDDVFEVFTDEQSNPDGFISEDDLPDWLRAFSDESGVSSAKTPDVSRIVATRPAVSAVATMVRVPPVENIWLTSIERNALGPGGALFALLAANGSSDSGVAHQSNSAHGTEPAQTSATRKESVARDGQPQQAASVQESGTQQPAKQANSMRLILLTLLIVMLVIAISVWQFS